MMASGRGQMRETQFSLRHSHWEFDYAPVSIWAPPIGLGIIFYLEELTRMGRLNWEGQEVSVIGVH